MNVTEGCQPFIDGRPISQEQFLRNELERSRIALNTLRAKIGAQEMEQLLSSECEEMDRRERAIAAKSTGEWIRSKVEIAVKGGNAEGFAAWFHDVLVRSDRFRLTASHPEHYGMAMTKDGRTKVIETTGNWGLPAVILVELGVDAEKACPLPQDIDSACQVRLAGYVQLRDGTDVGRVLHQFKNTADGFHATACIYWHSSSDPQRIEGHKWHLAVEFTNWCRLYLEDLQPDTTRPKN